MSGIRRPIERLGVATCREHRRDARARYGPRGTECYITQGAMPIRCAFCAEYAAWFFVRPAVGGFKEVEPDDL